MEKKNNLLIEAAIRKAYLNEEADATTTPTAKNDTSIDIECNNIIADIRSKLLKLEIGLKKLGLEETSRPMKQIRLMYDILATEFDPVGKKLTEYTTASQPSAAQAMVAEEKIYGFE
jgi:hypothetical protein